MAVKNSIAGRNSTAAIKDKTVEFKCGEETVKLSPSIVRNYLVNGNGAVTDQEVAMFINLCRFQHLNPFLREAYLIKFGSQPATIVTGKEAITKRAVRNPAYAGQQAGVVVMRSDTDKLEYRVGALVLPNETLVGGWAKVFVKNYSVPIEAVVGYAEYVGTKSDGTINGQWSKKPATMIRKVALTQALREAFPEDLGGLYESAEMGLDIAEEAIAPIPTEVVSAEITALAEETPCEEEKQEDAPASDADSALLQTAIEDMF